MADRQKIKRQVALVLVGWLWGLGIAVAAPEAGRLQRWAILTSLPLQQAGVGDLLTVELSGVDGIELVERDLLDAALKELEVASLMGPADGPARLQLGKQLGADRLLIVRTEMVPDLANPAGDKRQVVKLVVADCQLGIRLAQQQWVWAPEAAADRVADMAGLARNLQTQFAEGVRHLLVIPPALSRNLTHEFDALQSAYPEMLAQALFQVPGLAVLEIDEARELAEERQIAGKQPRKRLAPLYIETEFEMQAGSAREKPDVRLKVRVAGLPGKPFAGERVLAFDEAAAFFSKQFPQSLVKRLGGAPGAGISEAALFKQLVDRADAFAAGAEWSRAADLREAALLVDDQDSQEILRLIVHYYRYLQGVTQSPHADVKLDADARTAAVAERRARWLAMVRHVENVVARCAVNPREADLLVVAVTVLSDHVATLGLEAWRGDEVADLSAAQQANWRQPRSPEVRNRLGHFYRAVYSQFPHLDAELHQGGLGPALAGNEIGYLDRAGALSKTLPPEHWSAECQRRFWPLAAAIHFVTSTTSPAPLGHARQLVLSDGVVRDGKHIEERRSRALLYWLLTEVELPPFTAPMYLDGTRDEVQAFVRDLETTQQPSLVYAGRAVELRNELEDLSMELFLAHEKHGAGAPVVQDLLARVGSLDQRVVALAEYVTANGYQRVEPDPGFDPYLSLAGRHENTLLRWDPIDNLQEYRRRLNELRTRFGQTPVAVRPQAHFQLNFGDDPHQTRVLFRPIPDLAGDFREIRKLNGELDAVWGPTQVCVMPARGEMRCVYQSRRADRLGFGGGYTGPPQPDFVESVTWDGKHLWIATLQNGITVVSPIGESVGHVTSDVGLPPYRRLIVHPVSAGKCCVLGVFSEEAVAPSQGAFRERPRDMRLWIALVECGKDNRFKVDVFHQATRSEVPVVGDDDDPRQSFWPLAMFEWRARTADPLRLVVVRAAALSDAGRRPLQIDVLKRKVSVLPGKFLPQGWSRRHLQASDMICVNGQLFCANLIGFEKISPPTDDGSWSTEMLPVKRLPDKPGVVRSSGNVTSAAAAAWMQPVYEHAGKYLFPQNWLQFDPASQQVEELETFSRHFSGYGSSAHYGLVAWEDPLEDGGKGSTASARAVYEVLIDAKLSADEQLDCQFTHVPKELRRRHATAVSKLYDLGVRSDTTGRRIGIGPEFQGPDSALQPLADLYGVEFLEIAQAKITGDCLHNLTSTANLKRVEVHQTHLNAAALGWLAQLPALRELTLDGIAGEEEYTDADLRHLAGLKVERLRLYGPEITDAGVPDLQKLTVRDGLWLLYCRLGAEAVEKLKQNMKVSVSR